MVIQMNVAEAKAKLSQLLDAAAAGDHVVIARSGRPIVRLMPLTAPQTRQLGFMPGDVDDDLFAPLSDGAQADWE